MGPEHIGYRCPVCQADMLTKSDYKVGRRLQALHSLLIFLRLARPGGRGAEPRANEVLERTHYHNGKLTVTTLKRGDRV